MSVVIDLNNITKTYRTGEIDVPVLKGIDLTVHEGEQVAIMGRSGSGKSTLMNILGCLDRPTTGSYRLAGVDVSSVDDDEISRLRGLHIGFVFQSFHLLKARTVLKNVELPMEYQNVGAAERRDRAAHLLEKVGLAHRLDHRPHQLSGGERQRVAIARALANHPKVLLADEPTGNLDTRAREAVLQLFNDLQSESGLTTVMVTHDTEIGDRAKRLIILTDGRITQS